MNENMSLLEKIETTMGLLDKLAESHGRAKCGYIYIINEFLEKIRSDVLILEEQIQDLKKNETVSPE